MPWLKNQPWNENPSYQETTDEVEWNLWKARRPPFNDLEAGDQVFLACPDGSGGSVITWEVIVTKVVTSSYATKRDAWRMLRSAFPSLRTTYKMTTADFLNQGYTANASDAGWLLGWSYEPVRELRVPRPKELRIQPNGWLRLDGFAPDDLRRWGLRNSKRRPTTSDRTRPPRSTDPVKRAAVEQRSMIVAKQQLRRLGWAASEIVDTSKHKPYDFECRRGTRVVRVEVKGLSGPLTAVTLTRREAEHAKTGTCPMILIVVHGVELVPTELGWRGTLGAAVVWNPWEISDGHLVASSYDYGLPPLADQ